MYNPHPKSVILRNRNRLKLMYAKIKKMEKDVDRLLEMVK